EGARRGSERLLQHLEVQHHGVDRRSQIVRHGRRDLRQRTHLRRRAQVALERRRELGVLQQQRGGCGRAAVAGGGDVPGGGVGDGGGGGRGGSGGDGGGGAVHGLRRDPDPAPAGEVRGQLDVGHAGGAEDAGCVRG